MPAPVLLCSDGLDALDEIPGARRVLLVPDAADGLADGAEIVARDERRLARRGLDVATVRAADLPLEPDADAIVVGGGDPFALLAALRATGADARLAAALERGVAYVGLSAGALVAGPDLAPATRTAPFAPAPRQDLRGLDLAPLLGLPHHERPGRAERHRAALAEFAHRHVLVPLADDDAVVVRPGVAPAVVGPQRGLRLRSALPGDAAPIADVYLAASRAAWTSFLGEEVMATAEPPLDMWASLLAALPRDHAFVVATDDGVVVGFAHVDADAGELETFYTDPSRWGRGTGRALLELVHGILRAAGREHGTLWTEERNVRARRVYEAAGWRPEGVRERDWNGAHLRELRYRVALAPEPAGVDLDSMA